MQNLLMKKMPELTSIPDDVLKTELNFSDGVYIRTVTMCAESLVLGAKHKTKHMNIIHSGEVTFSIDGILTTVEAPCMFESSAGDSKVLYNHTEVVWSTIHVTDETDVEKLEAMLADFTIGDEQIELVNNFHQEIINGNVKRLQNSYFGVGASLI